MGDRDWRTARYRLNLSNCTSSSGSAVFANLNDRETIVVRRHRHSTKNGTESESEVRTNQNARLLISYSDLFHIVRQAFWFTILFAWISLAETTDTVEQRTWKDSQYEPCETFLRLFLLWWVHYMTSNPNTVTRIPKNCSPKYSNSMTSLLFMSWWDNVGE